MDKNPVAETQSGSQTKNKKGLGCWGWGCLTMALGFIGFTAVIVPQFASMHSPTFYAAQYLVNIYKACWYSEAKGGGTRPSDISPVTAELTAELPEYRISVGPTCFTAKAEPNDGSLPELSISYNNETGTATKTCLAGEHPHDCWSMGNSCCFADKDLTIKQEPGKPGYW